MTAPRFKPCQAIDNDKLRKRLILKDLKDNTDASDQINKHVKDFNENQNEPPLIDLQLDHKIDFTYENYNMNDALRVLLPGVVETDIPSGFEIIGEIAHLNIVNKLALDKRFEIG